MALSASPGPSGIDFPSWNSYNGYQDKNLKIRETTMAITKQKTKEIVEKFTTNPNDTGSSSVQIALLTERIQYLAKHIETNPKDHATKRGLSILVNKRKRFLTYLERVNREEYKKVIKQLGLRK
jgi:small subunit ribosomal protein S15